MKKTLALLIISSVILSSGCSPKQLLPVSREAFLEGIENNCGINHYSTNSITSSNVKNTISSLGGEYREYNNEKWDYAIQVDTSTIEDIEYCFYAEISHNVNINEAIESTDIFTMIGLLPYHYENNTELSQISCYGDTDSDRYLVYAEAYFYDEALGARIMLYRNEYTILGLISYSDSLFDYFTNSLVLPQSDETDCYFDFEGDDVTIIGDDSIYIYQNFESNDSALDYFANYYNSYLDICLEDNFDGFFRNNWDKYIGSAAVVTGSEHSSYEYKDIYYGYITLNGEFDDPQCIVNDDKLFYVEEFFYGGIYLHGNTVIIVYTSSSSERKQRDIDSLLSSFAYPVPPKKNRTIFEGLGNNERLEVSVTASNTTPSTSTTSESSTTVLQTTLEETTTPSGTAAVITTTTSEATTESLEAVDNLNMTIDDVSTIVTEAYGEPILEENHDLETRLTNDHNRTLGVVQVRYWGNSAAVNAPDFWFVTCVIFEIDTSSVSYSIGDTLDLVYYDEYGSEVSFPFTVTAINGQYIFCAGECYSVSEDDSIWNVLLPFHFEGLNNATNAFIAID